MMVLVALIAVAASLAYYFRPHPQPQNEAQISSTEDSKPAPLTPAPTTPESTSPQPTTQVPRNSIPRPSQPVTEATASPYARQLVAALAQSNITNGPLTPEKLAAWQSTIQQLTNAGPGVIPAIREFLQTKQDAMFDSLGGSATLGQPSLRLAMLDALSKIGGPEAVALTGETLRSTTDPREIATLARNLEQQAPGEFRQTAVDSARAALNDAIAGKLSNTDVAALFSVLQAYGGADVASDLQNAKGRYTYYSAIALAGLPDGAGVPGLTEMAQDLSPGARTTRSAALQSLAQLAADSPAAREAFLQQASNGSLPAATWIKISALLGGEQLQLGGQPDSGIPETGERKVSTYHLAGGNQNFYTTSIVDKLSADQINQRLQLIDQLLPLNHDQAATDSLQRARNALAGRLQTGAK